VWIGAVAGGIAGALVLGGFIGLGLLLGDRVASSLPVVILAIAGAYAGWLLGVIVFSAVRGGNPEEEKG
jgi:hypothetical protein